ncbi:MAG: hypothetical protein ACTHLR_08880 [Rhizomicrobium sp.]
MSEAQIKIERLISLTDRLAAMLSDDVAALERGNARALQSTENSFQQLMNIYAREAAGVNAAVAKSAPAPLRDRLIRSARQMNELLARHQRLVSRVRNASEGMIQAIAKEVERRRVSQRSYARMTPARPESSGAMIYNSVI